MKIVILTSKENFVWHSMQEIIPYIERKWELAADEAHEVLKLDVDKLSLAEILPQVLSAQYLVLTCFNVKVCKVAAFIREELKLGINFIIYVHNMATIAFWPFRVWGGKNFFKENDIFVTSCHNDEKTLKAVLVNPQILVLPFCNLEATVPFLNKKFARPDQLVYVGRISSQKNLHSLIQAYALVKKKSSLPKLTFFGKEDHLGSPNMGRADINYQEDLNSLVIELKLQDDIVFKGHVDRETINEFLTTNSCLCISASLHSDENFGMAVFQGLITGNRALLSNWGGHSDFPMYFPGRVQLMPVHTSERGPVLSAQTIANELELWNTTVREPIDFNPVFDIKNQARTVKCVLVKTYSNNNLNFTALADKILLQKKYFADKQQIFRDDYDPLFNEISKYYIGTSEKL